MPTRKPTLGKHVVAGIRVLVHQLEHENFRSWPLSAYERRDARTAVMWLGRMLYWYDSQRAEKVETPPDA